MIAHGVMHAGVYSRHHSFIMAGIIGVIALAAMVIALHVIRIMRTMVTMAIPGT
jgi:hypothetical protein